MSFRTTTSSFLFYLFEMTRKTYYLHFEINMKIKPDNYVIKRLDKLVVSSLFFSTAKVKKLERIEGAANLF